MKSHVLKKELCPAFGQKCNVCGRRNHWMGSELCPKGKQIHTVEYDSDSSNSDIATINPVIAHINGVETHRNKPIYCEMNVDSKPIKLQIDCGATVNLISLSKIGDKPLQPANITLQMWNKQTMKALGTCKLVVSNPVSSAKYLVKFVVVKDELTPLLSRKAAEKMNLITVNYDKFESVEAVNQIPSDIPDCFADVFNEELGILPGTVHLTVKPEATPVIRGPKRIPVELKEPVRKELDRLVDLGVLAPVDGPTDWVNQMAIGTKKDGRLRICIDPRSLNPALKREHYQLPVLEDILPDLAKAKVFSKVDLSHGYWHCVLDQQSSELTTFTTPFGRYRWTRLPFGLSASSEIFQKRLIQALVGLTGIACIADDILIYGAGDTHEEAIRDHNKNLTQLLERCREKSIRLNKAKLALRLTELDFMGHRLTSQGLKPDPNKVSAILNLEPPRNKEEVQRFSGAVNYLAKFLPKLSQIMEPIRRLTQCDVDWHWSEEHDRAFREVKCLVTQAPILAYYKPDKELIIQCDASGKGIGAALIQEGKPVAYASRALTDAETRYATIEKEMLAVVFSLEKWHQFTFGRHVIINSDHKPLESIIKKPLDRAPRRLQGMLLRCMAYDTEIRYTPGSTMHLADMMSRAYLPLTVQENLDEFEGVNAVKFLPMREEKVQQVRQATEKDATLQMLKEVILQGWPNDKSNVPVQLTPYFGMRDELGVHDGLVFKGERLVIPHSLREEMKRDIHVSHVGVEGCLRRARECLYWPGMNAELKHWISTCEPCRLYEVSPGKETLMNHDVAERPWERIAVDLFTLSGKEYLITVDYYSNFWELDKLENTKSPAVIRKLKAHFARYGSPCELVSDNGSQFVSIEFQKFVRDWDIEHFTISPHNSKANGKVEAAVKSAKQLLRKTTKGGEDQYLALLAHRNTPTQGVGTSPAQRLMNRRTRTSLPTTSTLLEPRSGCNSEREKLIDGQRRQALYYNRNAKDLTPLNEGDTVRMKPFRLGEKEWKKAIVTKRLDERSYEVDTGTTSYRRNRAHLRKTNELAPSGHLEEFSNPIAEQQTEPTKETHQAQRDKPQNQHGIDAGTPSRQGNRPIVQGNTQSQPTTQSSQQQESQKPPMETSGPENRARIIQTRSGRVIHKPNKFKDFVCSLLV